MTTQHIDVQTLVKRAHGGDREAMRALARMVRTDDPSQAGCEAASPSDVALASKSILYRRTKVRLLSVSGRRVCGYASTFEPPERHDSYGEVFAAGCYGEGLEDLRANNERLIMHNEHDQIIGNWDVFSEDLTGEFNDQGITGLYVEGNIDDSDDGRNALAKLNNGTYQGLSVGAWLMDWEVLNGQDGRDLAMTSWGSSVVRITKAYAFETSLTSYPANRYAEIMAIRSFQGVLARGADLQALREHRPSPSGLHDKFLVDINLNSLQPGNPAGTQPTTDEVERTLRQLDDFDARMRMSNLAFRAQLLE